MSTEPSRSHVSASARRPWWTPLRRWWWLPLLAGVAAGIAVGSLAEGTVGSSTSAVVNVRAASTLPNERLDLINDLSTVLRVSEVVDPVADDAGMTSGELRDAVTVARVEDSTQVRLTVTSDGDEAERRAVLEGFFEAAVGYLQPTSPSATLQQAQQAEADAIAAYYDAIEDNGGIAPPDELARLQDRIVEAARTGQTDRLATLRAAVPTVIADNRRFAELTAARDRATATLEEVTAADLVATSRGPQDLRLSYLDSSADQVSITSSVAVRRGVAAGLAAALVVGGLVVLLARRRRLR